MTQRLDETELYRFIVESNHIEGVHVPPTKAEEDAYIAFLFLEYPSTPDVCNFCRIVAGAQLRDQFGRDVRVGDYVPPRGRPSIRDDLKELLEDIDAGELDPFRAHVAFERLHPFMDGNGRTGRVLWLWQMLRDEAYRPALGFLHSWYYQSLKEIP